MDWFRSWHGAPTDPKWLVVAKRAGVPPGIVTAIVWALLDHASQAAERGSVADFDVETYSAFSGFDDTIIAAVLDALYDKGILTGQWRFAKWDERQPKREDQSTERVRAFRDRVKRNETQCNAPEKIQNRTEQKESAQARKAFWVLKGSKEWEAWTAKRGKPPVVTHRNGTEGQWLPSQWPPSKEHVA